MREAENLSLIVYKAKNNKQISAFSTLRKYVSWR